MPHGRFLYSSFICFVLFAFVSFLRPVGAAPVGQAIKLDHFGYRPNDVKVAVFSENPGSVVEIRTTNDTVVFTIPGNGGTIVSKGYDGAPSGDTIWWVDFSILTEPGTYRLYSPALGKQSYDFEIREDIYNAVLHTALKTFYYQRCNTPKSNIYAGAWADESACHMTDTATGPASGHTNYGTCDLTGGWHDAGDYNKYVSEAVSTAILFLLRAYEDNPGAFADGDLNIPESGNGIPDILDEIKWELDWMLNMQLGSGAVLSQMHVDGYDGNSPPSADTNIRYYQNPNMESGAVVAGTFSCASRVYDSIGMTSYAATLKTAALNAWSWLLTQGDSEADNIREIKVWAAAEIFCTEPDTISARNYVDTFYPNNWADRFFNVASFDTHAAVTYIQTLGATATVVANMRANIRYQVDYLFSKNDLYRNGMPSWSYHWGSNTPRAAQGIFLMTAAKLNETGSHTAGECRHHAQNFLHFFHGQNALNMMYLSNMASLGGEHSSFQFYHDWFGMSGNTFSETNFVGKPSSVEEPDYPYFKGVDNLGVSDNKISTYGPAPGFVPGGPNASYSGTAIPPGGAIYYNRYYRDWADQTDWAAVTWEITENSIGYQGSYAALAAYFADPDSGTNPGPAAPGNLSATVISSTSVELSWTDNADNEDGFKIERSTNGVNFSQIATTNANTPSYTDSDCAAGTTYYYRVRAYNTAGNSNYSNIASATTLQTIPAAPGNLTATALKKAKISLNWADNSSNETGFSIERSTSSVPWTQIATVGTNATTYTDSKLTAGITYSYRIRSYNSAGNSDYSNVTSATAKR
ncbi:endoglucanase [Candidatus Brocadiaceae bacterium]|nr:endoglucanase [Candidatus Brocadiaceae bacterium]